MMFSWWWMWIVVMALFWMLPMGYGWGYRGSGPPYPRYIQQRRGARAAASGGSATFNHQSWGWGGDFIWLVLLFGAFCAGCVALVAVKIRAEAGLTGGST